MIHPHATALDRALAEQDAYVEAKLTGAPHEDALALAREDAFRRMRAHGFRTMAQGIAMQRPHEEGFNGAGVYVIDDWR